MPQGHQATESSGLYLTFEFFSLITWLSAVDQYALLFQVNPHTHQVKLCDFGSAKVLVFINFLLNY